MTGTGATSFPTEVAKTFIFQIRLAPLIYLEESPKASMVGGFFLLPVAML